MNKRPFTTSYAIDKNVLTYTIWENGTEVADRGGFPLSAVTSWRGFDDSDHCEVTLRGGARVIFPFSYSTNGDPEKGVKADHGQAYTDFDEAMTVAMRGTLEQPHFGGWS